MTEYVGRHRAPEDPWEELDLPVNVLPTLSRYDSRDPECVAEWPECFSGGYDPRCCRFPKSCSC